MVYDLISYNGEREILKLRLNILSPHVDKFIICEAKTTFCGSQKPLYFHIHEQTFKKFWRKIEYHIIDESYTPREVEEATNSQYTNGVERWVREYLQKEAIKKALTGLHNEDIVYIGDVDEIWEHKEPSGIEKLKLHVYTYYLNLLSTEEFWGTIRARYKDVKDKCFNEIRNNIEYRTQDYQGWHFTNQGGLADVRRKIIDQYNPEIFNKDLILSLPERFGKTDIIGRDFKLEVNETNLPEYLKKNRTIYKHLCL